MLTKDEYLEQRPMIRALRTMYRSCERTQKARVADGNSLVANFKAKLGIEPGQREDDIDDKEVKKILKALQVEYELISEKIAKINTSNFEGARAITQKDGHCIDTFSEFLLVENFVALLAHEEATEDRMALMVQGIPIWDEFLQYVDGVGPKLGAMLISEFNVHEAPYPSSFHKYAGFDVVKNEETGQGEGRSRKKSHQVPKQYTDADDNLVDTVGLSYNPKVKTKLYVLGECMMKIKNRKTGVPGHYKAIYNGYKNRIENLPRQQEGGDPSNPELKPRPKSHIDMMSRRYMLKIFLTDLHMNWRELEGLPVSVPYAQEKLGLEHKNPACDFKQNALKKAQQKKDDAKIKRDEKKRLNSEATDTVD